MKKIFLILAMFLGLALVFAPLSMALTVEDSFEITVNVPTATGVSISAAKVVGTTYTPVDAFDFGFVSSDFKPALGIWLPNFYFVIDIGVTDGAGSTDITLTYEEGDAPSGQPDDKTLGYKTTAEFFSITGGPAPEDQTTTPIDTAVGSKALLFDLIGGVNITPTMLDGGFSRTSIGIYAGDDAATLPDGSPFTNSDRPGGYAGTLLVSATLY